MLEIGERSTCGTALAEKQQTRPDAAFCRAPLLVRTCGVRRRSQFPTGNLRGGERAQGQGGRTTSATTGPPSRYTPSQRRALPSATIKSCGGGRPSLDLQQIYS